jgi:hypothetical protein
MIKLKTKHKLTKRENNIPRKHIKKAQLNYIPRFKTRNPLNDRLRLDQEDQFSTNLMSISQSISKMNNK